jgi:hypothetical protein
MIKLFKSSEESKSFIDTYSDPFKSDKIESITMNISKEIFKPYAVQFYAHISFKNGNTNGSHKITADDFPSLVQKVETFIKSLN